MNDLEIDIDEETLSLINSTVPENERKDAIRIAKIALLAEKRSLEKKVKTNEHVTKKTPSFIPAASVVYVTKAQREAQRAEAERAEAQHVTPTPLVNLDLDHVQPQNTSNHPSSTISSTTYFSSIQSIESAEIEASKERYLGKSNREEKDEKFHTFSSAQTFRGSSRGGGGGGGGGYRITNRGGAMSSSSTSHGGLNPSYRSSQDLVQLDNNGPTIVSILKQKSSESGHRRRERFKFQWENTEDTSTDINSLYTYSDATSTTSSSSSFFHREDLERPIKRPNIGFGTSREIDDDAFEMNERDRKREELEEVAAARRVESKNIIPGEESMQGSTHWSKKKLSEMTERDWRIFREDFDIHMRGNFNAASSGAKENNRVIVNPLRSWDECSMHPRLRDAINEMKYEHPSPIQRAALPMGMAGRDMIGIAETGSGKTAAFLIPLLHTVLMQTNEARARCAENGPLALVMAPTRELAQQIDEECRKLSRFCNIKSLAVVGGTNMAEQGVKMREGCEVIIGTPGRLIDCISTSILVLNQCNYVVLDEADRMIDLGFEPQVSQILECMGLKGSDGTETMGVEEAGTSRTTHMFTATMPNSVERLAKRFMKSPATLRIGDQDSGKNKRILQEIIFVQNEKRKRAKLIEMLSSVQRPCIIFINAKKACNVVARDVEYAGHSCVVLHSDKSQEEREGALRDFKSGSVDLLIATDVAGRGLDIAGVETVINYDMPSEIARYTHRIGRTGRAGKAGKATTFITEEDSQILPDLKAYLESTSQVVPHELSSRISTLERARGDRRG